jgi:hypothetical protein
MGLLRHKDRESGFFLLCQQVVAGTVRSSRLLLEQYVQAGCYWNGTFKQVVTGTVRSGRLLLEEYVQAGCCWNSMLKQAVARTVGSSRLLLEQYVQAEHDRCITSNCPVTDSL